MRDYDELVKRLRSPVMWDDGEDCDACEMLQDDAADAIEELLKENGELENSGRVLMAAFARLKEKVPHWISVEERLPHYLDHVLCVNKYGIQMVGHLTDYKEGGFRCESGMDSCDYITHWMPLPAPPKEVLPNGDV